MRFGLLHPGIENDAERGTEQQSGGTQEIIGFPGDYHGLRRHELAQKVERSSKKRRRGGVVAGSTRVN